MNVCIVVQQRPDFTTVSEKMSCNYCSADFESREDQVLESIRILAMIKYQSFKKSDRR